MNLERFIAALEPIEIVSGPQAGSERGSVDVDRDLAYDTRTVTPGALFFCVPGRNADGHAFAPTAAALGAVALVVERPLERRAAAARRRRRARGDAGRGRASSSTTPPLHLPVAGGHRDEREDHDRLPAPIDPRGGRAARPGS